MSEEWTISDAEYERRTKQAQVAAAEGAGREPSPQTGGFFSYGDAPGGIGGGIGCFMWFETPDELLTYLKKHLTFLSSGPSFVDPGRVSGQVEKMLGGVSVEALTSGDKLIQLNDVLKGFSQIEWVGQFSDLLSGTGEFPAKVRAWYRDDDSDSGGDPIPPQEVGDFTAQIAEYGI